MNRIDGSAASPMCILIVEDDPVLLAAMAEMVQRHGFEARCAEDGHAALQILAEDAVPIVLTDRVMPRVDGLELVRRIRSDGDGRYTYVVMLTASADPDIIRDGMAAGVDDFLVKPCSNDELLARLNVARRIMGLQREIADTNRVLRRSNRELRAYKERTEQELTAAAQVQRMLLPTRVPRVPGFAVGWSLEPCEALAGDVLNLFWLDDGQLAVYVLDVSGHGVAAALLSVQLSRLLSPDEHQSRLLVRREGSGELKVVPPADVMAELNQRFPMSAQQPQFFTLIYGVLDVASRRFRFSAAGHPGPVVDRPGADPRPVWLPGTPIGMFAAGQWSEAEIRLEPGDRLVLYSDGLIEASRGEGELFGEDHLLEALVVARGATPEASCRAVVDRVRAWCDGSQLQDDVSLLVMEAVS